MAIQITFRSYNQSGGSGADAVQSADYAAASDAVSAISTGFLEVANPVGPGGALNAAAYNVSEIKSIVTISAVTYPNE